MPALSSVALRLGIDDDAFNTWQIKSEQEQARYGGVIRFGRPTNNFITRLGYAENPPVPRRVPWGEKPTGKALRYRSWDVVTRRVMSEIDYKKVDRELGNIGDIKSAAEAGGRRFATYVIKVLYQLIEGTTNPDLLPSATSVLAPDGAAMFSATDGASADRFGISGGNIVGSQSITTGPAFYAAVWAALERILTFQDEDGEPVFPDEGILEQGVTIIFPTIHLQSAAEAFRQSLRAFAASGENAGVSNTFMDMGVPFTLIGTPRLATTTAAYVFLQGAPIEPLVETEAMALNSMFFDESNSVELAREGKELYIHEKWAGYGLNLPIGACKTGP